MYQALNGESDTNRTFVNVTVPKWMQFLFLWVALLFTIQFGLQCAVVGYLNFNKEELSNQAMEKLIQIEQKAEDFAQSQSDKFYTLLSTDYFNIYQQTANNFNSDIKYVVKFMNTTYDEIKLGAEPTITFFWDWYRTVQAIKTNTDYLHP